ncbi:MAG: DUF72 domain-containing protein, partial [Anaerolineales bacterium]
MEQEDRVHIGTSGWVYDHWQGPFYPEDLPQEDWFGHFADTFDTVEINNTFYQLPEESQFQAWREQAPGDFTYAVKANRYITHMKKLNDPAESVANFIDRVRILERHLGPILWQLPPNWHANPERLRSFAALIPEDITHVFEFRDPDWFQEEVKSALQEAGLGFVIFAMPELECPRWVTGDIVYLRFHGSREKYVGQYGREKLEPWAERIQRWVD